MLGKRPDSQAENHSRVNMQHVTFIRHGESEAHIGKAATHIEEVGLTLAGKKKALEIANGFSQAPDLIIVSPYLRAWETADPTMERIPATPCEIWSDVREFTYLGSLAGLCLTKPERSGMVNAFWGRCDPLHRDGNGESFSQFLWRARRVLELLRQRDGFVVVFTHEQFIRIVQCALLRWIENAEATPEHMKGFREMLLNDPLPYGYIDGESWSLPFFQEEHVLAPTPLTVK